MIIGVYKPVKENKKVTSYSILNIGDLYNKGSQRYKVSYICDGIRCKTPDKIYSITREHLNEKRSKTVNDKIQICRSCQTTGENNPRFGDNRTWNEIFSKEISDRLRKNLSDRSIGDKNPSKNNGVKEKKNQIIINYENVNKYLNQYNFKLNSIEGDNKFSKLNITCNENHTFNIQWASFRVSKKCRYCYYDSIRIPFEEIERFETYSKTVRSLTRFIFNKNKSLIDPNGLKELDSKKYHIDHIYSISDGYRNDVDPKIIASYHNLRVVKKLENLQKGRKSGMELSELLEKINNQDYHKN
jgi:hypothetical protein